MAALDYFHLVTLVAAGCLALVLVARLAQKAGCGPQAPLLASSIALKRPSQALLDVP